MGWYNYLLRLGQFFLETKSPLHFHTPKHIAAFYVYTEGKHAPHSTYIQTTTNYSALHLVSQNVRERERRMLIFLEYAMSCFTCIVVYYYPWRNCSIRVLIGVLIQMIKVVNPIQNIDRRMTEKILKLTFWNNKYSKLIVLLI